MRTPLLHRLAGDDTLAARAGAGDDLAFAALVRRVQPRLHAYCAAILGDAQDADDAVQNTFINALASLRREEPVLAVRPWLFRIAHNEAVSLMRRRRPASELVATVEDHAKGPAETVAVREEVRAVLHAIGELPDRSRDALLLREVAGMRHAEVADVLGTSPGNARQAVFEARVALQDDRAGRDASCHTIREELSARERRRASRAVRGHLRTCSSCRAWSDAQAQRRKVLGIAPGAGLPLVGAGGLWAWIGGLVGGGAAGGGATVKIVAGVAAVATIAPVGVGTLERELRRHDRQTVASPGPTRTATTQRTATAQAAPASVAASTPAAGTDAAQLTGGLAQPADEIAPATKDERGEFSLARDRDRDKLTARDDDDQDDDEPAHAPATREDEGPDGSERAQVGGARVAPHTAGHWRERDKDRVRSKPDEPAAPATTTPDTEPEPEPEPEPVTTTQPAPIPAPPQETTTTEVPVAVDEGHDPAD